MRIQWLNPGDKGIRLDTVALVAIRGRGLGLNCSALSLTIALAASAGTLFSNVTINLSMTRLTRDENNKIRATKEKNKGYGEYTSDFKACACSLTSKERGNKKKHSLMSTHQCPKTPAAFWLTFSNKHSCRSLPQTFFIAFHVKAHGTPQYTFSSNYHCEY